VTEGHFDARKPAMKKSSLVLPALTLTLASFGFNPARAEVPPTGTVTGQGTFELKRQPEYLRVQVDVLAKGKDVKEALAKLREQRQAAQKQLEALGFDPKSIDFGEPKITTEKSDRGRHMEMMMRRMRNQGKKTTQKPKEAPPIFVSSALKAELRLAAADPEELLIAAHTLEQRMKAADLGGAKDLKQVSPQDEELAQEQAEEFMDFNEADGPKRGEPIFLYISKVSEEEQAKALAQAFKNAKRQASQLAQAAGVALGSLHHLEDHSSASAPEELGVLDNPYSYRLVQQAWQLTRTASEDARTGEAIGLQPGKVSYRIAVSASFELKAVPK
jgi:uncharacterized protein YggE